MPEHALHIAAALAGEFAKRHGAPPEEAVMHKLMYLVQRESLIEKNEVLFTETFLAWRSGPVLPRMRAEFRFGDTAHRIADNISADSKKLVNAVLDRYGRLSAWELNCLCHQELSWKIARKGLVPSENGNAEIQLSAMMLDVIHQKIIRDKHII